MAKFKKTKNEGSAQISTASLPDIIFMLLFFFMVTTTMRETTLFVQIKLPESTEIQKLEKKSLVSYIYIGKPYKSELYGTLPVIQLNNSISKVSDIAEFVGLEREARKEEDRSQIITSLKIDKDTKMGIVTDVKQELRKVEALKINYSSKEKMQK